MLWGHLVLFDLCFVPEAALRSSGPLPARVSKASVSRNAAPSSSDRCCEAQRGGPFCSVRARGGGPRHARGSARSLAPAARCPLPPRSWSGRRGGGRDGRGSFQGPRACFARTPGRVRASVSFRVKPESCFPVNRISQSGERFTAVRCSSVGLRREWSHRARPWPALHGDRPLSGRSDQ